MKLASSNSSSSSSSKRSTNDDGGSGWVAKDGGSNGGGSGLHSTRSGDFGLAFAATVLLLLLLLLLLLPPLLLPLAPPFSLSLPSPCCCRVNAVLNTARRVLNTSGHASTSETVTAPPPSRVGGARGEAYTVSQKRPVNSAPSAALARSSRRKNIDGTSA